MSLCDEMERAVSRAGSPEERVRVFNEIKDREMFRVDLRYITGRTDFGEFAQEVTTLAEAVVQRAFEMSIQSVAERRGLPTESAVRVGHHGSRQVRRQGHGIRV